MTRWASWLTFLLFTNGAAVALATDLDTPAISATPDTAAPAEVVVTGSRIPVVGGQTFAPVTVITSQELEDRGFRNAFEALNTLPQNTGFTQGADFGNTFTPAAKTISLRGLGPNHTLILFDGRRVADYPDPYNGTVNFVNLANIPTSAIDRIEILSGGDSAIYGSDAIAGVVNVILKDHADGVDVNVKAGTTQHGGGGEGRLQVTGGKKFDRLSTVFSLELSTVEPIFAQNRDFMTSRTLLGGSPTVVWSRQQLPSQNYINPGDGCASFGNAFSHSVASYDTGSGVYCGSGKASPTYWTTQTGNDSGNLYGRLKYELNDTTRLFSSVLLGWNRTWNNTRTPLWISDQATTSYFLNQNSGNYESWTRRFAPEEIGGVDNYNQYWRDFSAVAAMGIEGEIGASGWRYEASYSGSGYSSRNERPRLLVGIDNYFLGPQLGVDNSGVPIYAPDAARFDQPLTGSQFATLMGHSTTQDNSWLQTASATVNGEPLRLPAGPLGMAVSAEWGTQGYSNAPDPQINQGAFFNVPPQEKASGSRSRYAAALEFKVPILPQLSAQLATRFDEYSFSGRSQGKPTYSAGLEFHPVDAFQVHANYATSFRAPDMNYIYQVPTRGYEAESTDYYLCAVAKQPLSSCPNANVSPGANFIQTGSRNLGFENGRSFDYGIVFSPSSHLRLTADYWNIRIDNEVTLVDFDQLLRTESACRLGQQDPNSPACVDALNRVSRNSPNSVFQPNAITNLLITPINASFEQTDGIDLGARLQWSFQGVGDFVWNTTFTRTMSHYFQQFANSAPLDLIKSFDNPNGDSDFPNKLTTTLTWSLQNWTSTLEVDRFGSIINQAQTAFLTPTALVNVSAQYRLGNATIGVIVNNLLDTVKRDNSAGWPYYPVGYYYPYGRAGWVEFNYHFGT